MAPLQSGAISTLAPEAAARKRSALDGYLPLRQEGDTLLRKNPDALFHEQIRAGSYDWPERQECPPEYEAIGRTRAISGLYRQPITYAGHVRPMAIRLRQHVLM
jgi:hypothetical protein